MCQVRPGFYVGSIPAVRRLGLPSINMQDGPQGFRTNDARMVGQVTSSVRWEACIRAMIADGVTRFIELGPGTALTGFMRRIDRGLEVLNVADNDSLAKSAEALNA